MAFKVYVVAGHGGRNSTPGKRTPDGEYEWNFNNKVVDAFIDELSQYEGVKIKRGDDASGNTDVPLSTRTNEANAWGADIYVSEHHNANTGTWGTWTGTETYYYEGSKEGRELAELLHNAALKAYGLRDRGIKRGNHLWEMRKTTMTAVLVEGGFMDSRVDIQKMRNDAVLKKSGRLQAQAVAEYAGLKEGNSAKKEQPKKKSAPKKKVKSKKVNGKIAYIQKMLNDRYAFNIAVDNITGPQTKKALVKGYQTELNKQFKRNLKVDGIFGSRSRNASVNVSRGARGNLTWIIQATLVCKGYVLGVDSIFGNETERKVKEFQKGNRLTVDGIVGRNTWDRLLR